MTHLSPLVRVTLLSLNIYRECHYIEWIELLINGWCSTCLESHRKQLLEGHSVLSTDHLSHSALEYMGTVAVGALLHLVEGLSSVGLV